MEKGAKFILIGLGVVALAGGGYFLYKRSQKKAQKNRNASLIDEDISSSETSSSLPPVASSVANTRVRPSGSGAVFPLKRGSRGSSVKKLQEALIAKYGSGVLPKYGADSSFGSELTDALASKGLPTTVDQVSYDKIISDKKTTTKTPPKKEVLSRTQYAVVISKRLKTALGDRNLNYLLQTLGNIKNKEFYVLVDNDFKRTPPKGDWTKKSIFRAISGTYTDKNSISQIGRHFARIGFKKGQLSGIDDNQGELVTIYPTKVWTEGGYTIEVPEGTVLGKFISGSNGVTEFETRDFKRLFTATSAIQDSRL